MQLRHGTEPCHPPHKPRTNNRSSHADPDQLTGENYPYRRLEHENSIRLLLITPGSGEEATYTLLHAELDNIPYKALSYEWGLPSDDDPNIIIDGHSVRIRKNLSEALKQISSVIHYLGFLFLWIDALCINQSDNAEKNNQVLKMGQIFSEADQVFAWTGSEANDSDCAMDILYSISTASPSDSISMVKALKENYRAREAILTLCNRSYWKRIWTLQERVLAKDLVFMCGSKSIAERQLYECLPLIIAAEESLRTKYTDFLGISLYDTVGYRQICASFWRIDKKLNDWLQVCAECDLLATDPRDYVYALLSISTDVRSGILSVIPDYDKPTRTLFQEIYNAMRDIYGADYSITYRRDIWNAPFNKWLNKNFGFDEAVLSSSRTSKSLHGKSRRKIPSSGSKRRRHD